MDNYKQQLKGMDFLQAVTQEPKSIATIIEELSDRFRFADSYVDFLVAFFEQRGRVVRDENGDISLSKPKTHANRYATLYKVAHDGDGQYVLLTNDDGKVAYAVSQGQPHGNGWSLTINSAIKKASSENFAEYKANSEAIKALATGEAQAVTLNEAGDGWEAVEESHEQQ